MMNEQSYRVDVVRSGDWWAITVPELSGVFSQARRLDQVEDNAREAIAMMLDVDESTVNVDLDVSPPGNVAALLEALTVATVSATEATEEAARMRVLAARELRDQGLPLRDVGALIGVSHQRVHQLLAS